MPEFRGLERKIGGGESLEPGAGAGMTYYPTLLVGMGGTGAEVLIRVKRLLREHGAGPDSLHRFLFIDTDRSTFSQKPGYPRVEQFEQCLVGVDRVRTVLDHRDMHAHIWRRFPPTELKENYIRNLATGLGASQIRSLGALAFTLDYPQVRQGLTNAFNELVEIARRKREAFDHQGAAIGGDVAVYIVGSLAGGTGAGCFLDVALLAKDVCGARNPKLVGVFALPNASFDAAVRQDTTQSSRLRANAYSALKELQYVLDAGTPERAGPVTYDYATSGSLELLPGDRLFYAAYLVDDQNAVGRLTRIEDLYDLMARSIFQDVGSTFGASAASFDSNNQALNEVQSCPESHRSRLLGAISTSALVYPAERVSLYVTYRLLEEVLADRLLGAVPPLAELESAVTGFLQEHRLDDRGGSNQILDGLLFDGDRNQVLTATEHGLRRAWGDKLDVDEFATQIDQKWQAFTTVDLPRIRVLVEANAKRLLGQDRQPPDNSLLNAVRDFALDFAGRHNSASVQSVLEILGKVVAQMREELESELSRWVTRDRETFRQDFNKRRDELTHLHLAFLRKKDEVLKTGLVNLFNDMITQELWACAKPVALSLLNDLADVVRTETARWVSLTADLASLRRESESEHRRLETRMAGPTGRFVVEQEVTGPGYERRYFDSQRPQTTEMFAKTVDTFGGSAALYRWLLDIAPVDRVAESGARLGGVIYDAVSPSLLRTNVVDFVASNPDEVKDDLGTKLDLMFQMCQPFWSAKGVTADMVFPEFLALSVFHRDQGEEKSVPPPVVRDWVSGHAPGTDRGRYQILQSAVPYEITLGRRTYGARAYYLAEARQWREVYGIEKKSASGRYMMESHAAFMELPDLFPPDTKALDAFAVGMALGFIVTRGDWYYYGLERGEAGARVLYGTQAETIFSAAGAAPRPEAAGDIRFECKQQTKLPANRKLGQGRESAAEALRGRPDWMEAIAATVVEYHQAVGNDDLRKQLDAYVKTVLEAKSQGDDFLATEVAVIQARLASLGR